MRVLRRSASFTALAIGMAAGLWGSSRPLHAGAQAPASGQPPAAVTAIRAGRLLDPEAGRVLSNQVSLVEGTRIREVGPNVAIPAGAQVIDLSQATVMTGLVEAHNHLALTHKPI